MTGWYKLLSVPISCVALYGIALAYNQTPIEDFSSAVIPKAPSELSDQQASSHPLPITDLPIRDQVAILSRRLDSYAQMNLANTIEKLQRRVETLQGQLEVQAHTIKFLQKQQKQFYQDLDKRLKSSHQNSNVVNDTSSVVAVKNQVAVSPSDDLVAYRAAFNLLKIRRYESAIKAFKEFTVKYPNSRYTVNAYYWMGEIYQVQGKLKESMQAFTLVTNRFSKSQKVPDALLKLAIITRKRGDVVKARHAFEELTHRFPDSSAARLAKQQLSLLSQGQSGSESSS